jgi:hypothetical protein
MVATDNITNPNQLSQLNFKLAIKRSPTLSYFCQRAIVPGLILPATHQPTPLMDIPVFGDKVTFNPLVVTFKVDEDLKNYFEIHSWMRALGNADDSDNFKALAANPQYTGIGLKSEILLTIENSARRSNFNVTFYDAFPVSLSDLAFDATASDLATVTASAEFRYLNFDHALV